MLRRSCPTFANDSSVSVFHTESSPSCTDFLLWFLGCWLKGRHATHGLRKDLVQMPNVFMISLQFIISSAVLYILMLTHPPSNLPFRDPK